MQISRQVLKFPIIQSDITNYCNLRCKFCLTDFSRPASAENMSKETFKKSIQLLPLADDNAFHFSCAFEPMLNPDFLELLEMFPFDSKSKVLFTTNLSKRLSDDDILRMAHSNVNRINISLETFDPLLYTRITGVKKSYITENLERIAEIFQTVENAPRLCFITMVLRDNYDEILSIAQKVSDRYFPMHHTFRTPYNFNVKNEYNEANLLPRDRLDNLERELKVAFPQAVIEFGSDELSYYQTITNDNENYFNFNEHYLVTVNPDGTGEFRADHSAFDLNKIDDIPLYFAHKRTHLQQLQCERTPQAQLCVRKGGARPPAGLRLTQVILYEERFLLLNAVIPCVLEEKATEGVYWNIAVNRRRYCCHTNRVRSQGRKFFIVESLIDLAQLNVDKIKSLSVTAVVGKGKAAQSYKLLRWVAWFARIRGRLGKVKRWLVNYSTHGLRAGAAP